MTCRHCRQPIEEVRCGGRWWWVHARNADGFGGGFPCRDVRCGLWLDTYAAPGGPPPAFRATVTVELPRVRDVRRPLPARRPRRQRLRTWLRIRLRGRRPRPRPA